MIKLDFPSKSEMLPAFEIMLHNSSIDIENREQLVKVALQEYPNILALKSKYSEADPFWITGKLWAYNFLDFNYPCVRYLQKFIHAKYLEYALFCNIDISKPVYVRCWVNFITNNKMINPHHHAGLHGDSPVEYSYISGNLCLQTENTSTCFSHPISHIDIHREIPNVDGELILFPSFLMHRITPVTKGKRNSLVGWTTGKPFK
jgi:hypothetical protein